MGRRVLLASMNAGGGHHALRDSFHTVLERMDPGHRALEPVIWNSADRFIEWFYSVCVRHLTRFQGTVYDLSSRTWAIEVGMRLSPRLLREVQSVLRSEPLELVVTTHPLLGTMFTRARAALGLSIPIIGAVPDYGMTSLGYYPPQPALRPDALIVMAEDTWEFYHSEGVPTERLHLSGFLTRPPFTEVGRRRRAGPLHEVRAALRDEIAAEHPSVADLALDRPTLVFLGGSAWTAKTGPVLERIFSHPELLSSVNLLVVCGRDPGFRATIVPFESDRVKSFGFVRPEMLARLMGLGDVAVLGSLAPATLQELLEVGLGPMLLHHFIPGSERYHVGYIEAQRVGLYEPDPDRMVELVREAVGASPVSDRLAAVQNGFAERARAIRAASVERAMHLPDFLGSVIEGTTSDAPLTAAS